MTRSRSAIPAVLFATILLAGCQEPPANPPQTPPELQRHREHHTQEFTDRTIVLYNLKRVLSQSLPVARRLDSLRVLEQVGASEVEAYPALATLLADEQAPTELRQEVLMVLVRSNYPGLGEHVRQTLPHAQEPALRGALLEWLSGHPVEELLADVVKLWSAEKSPSPETEARYRQTVEQIARKKWDDALVESLNAEEFLARGSAIAILTTRVPLNQLRRRIAGLQPRTQAVRTMQYFSERFAYLPRNARELLASAVVLGKSPERLDEASRLGYEWHRLYGYGFNIRDFHVLSALASDPLRKPATRQEMVLDLSKAIASRRRTRLRLGLLGPREGFRSGRLVAFDAQVEMLSVADLHNLHLINEMLDRPRVRQALKIMAGQDRADTETRWGGLIRYEQGQAEAGLYRPASTGSDDQYVASWQMLDEAADAMAFFFGHFRRIPAAGGDVGPDEDELAFAKTYNLYGVILSAPSADTLNATYFNPDGTVIDLGDFPTGP